MNLRPARTSDGSPFEVCVVVHVVSLRIDKVSWWCDRRPH